MEDRKMKRRLCIILTAFLFLGMMSASAMAEEQECIKKTRKMDNVSMYKVVRVSEEEDPGKKYEAIIKEIEAFAERHQLKDFSLISQDASLNKDYSMNDLQLTLSVSFRHAPDYTVLNKLRQEMKLQTINTSRYEETVCQ
jgi:hypothetical protein